MHILIHSDSATKIPKEVDSVEDAQAFVNRGFTVTVQNEAGDYVPLSDLQPKVTLAEYHHTEIREVIPVAPPAKAEAKKPAAKKVPAKAPAKKAKK